MIGYIAKKIFGTKNARIIKGFSPSVACINDLEPAMKGLSDEDLRGLTGKFRERIDRGESLDALLPEAFAACREAARRILGMRHYDVQLIGGMVLNRGSIAEMKTGEGKTLVATLAVYLNALSGKGVHLVTVNEYLAARDAEWMGRIYSGLGMSVGVITQGLSNAERQKNYGADITYGTNSEFGFDYLRDNMKDSIERYVQRDLNFAIVDEVDSILIDEARTPLIISGPTEQSADLYMKVNAIIPGLRKDIDYSVDEKAHSAILTDSGVERVEQRLSIGNLYAPENLAYVHHVGQALRAHSLYKRDVNYLVEDGNIVIVDEFTGRKMSGRRWSDGLHQAVEAKESVEILEENQTLATISYQNYFRLYSKLAGMTGTADTEAEEFHKIYNLDVTVIPTNRPIQRADQHDVVYMNEKGKFRALVNEIEGAYGRGQPVLVGTVSVEKSEVVASLLRKKNIPHSVLNAKQHQREAEIVAQAGRKGMVTISTNMAGRGTDIILGGNAEYMARSVINPEMAGQPGAVIGGPEYETELAKFKAQCDAEKKEVLAAGGLHILGTERHESRRIDNQLRGRAGRQGDPGSSHFYISLEDDLMRIFGAERMQAMMGRLGMQEDEPIEHSLINRAIENAQKKVEGHHFDSRKNLLEYDDVMNQQRKSVYALRKQILTGRYVPELTEDEKKAGKKQSDAPVPTESGHHTTEKLSALVRPVLARMVMALSHQVAQEGSEGAKFDGAANMWLREIEMDPAALASSIYRQFGVVLEAKGIAQDRTGTLDRLANEIAGGLIQQRERILDICEAVIQSLLDERCPVRVSPDDWDLDALSSAIHERFGYEPKFDKAARDRNGLAEFVWSDVEKIIEARETEFSLPMLLYFSRMFMLEEIDQRWIDHLKGMEQLREGIGLRGYGQKDPKQEYKREGYNIFQEMMEILNRNVVEKIFHMQIERNDEADARAQQEAAAKRRAERQTVESGGSATPGKPASAEGEPAAQTPMRRQEPKVGRNDPCPCGSGKKYKKCHGENA